MENVSHTLLGAAMVKAGLEKVTPLAMPICLIAANLPDVDALSIFGGQENYFTHHRGVTHSFLGICVLSILLAWVMRWYDRKVRLKRNSALPPAAFKGLLIVAFLGLLSHLVMDYTNSYGIRPFLPFSGRWFYGDLAFIVDPWIWAIPGIGLLISWKSKSAARQAAVISIAGLLGYWGGLFYLHHAAIERMAASRIASLENATIGALPVFGHPFQWRCIVETPDRIFLWREDLLQPENHGSVQSFARPQIPEAMARIAETSVGKDFLGFARFTKTDVMPDGDHTEVVLRDLRFNLRACFLFDKHWKILEDGFLPTRFRIRPPNP